MIKCQQWWDFDLRVAHARHVLQRGHAVADGYRQ
jgi:hypothetical protein